MSGAPGRWHPREPVRAPEPRFVARGTAADLPAWAQRWNENAKARAQRLGPDLTRTEHGPGPIRLRSVVLHGALELETPLFERHAQQAYAALLADIDPSAIARVWNFVPGISGPMDATRNRYMAFNAARFSAFHDLPARPGFFPVASGVGHAGDDLVLHLLHGDFTVTPFANPRQRAPEHYSERYGPLPPVFARGALVRGNRDESWVVIAGTASIVGEDSIHPGDFASQLDETLLNLEHVAREAGHALGRELLPEALSDWLVYLPDMHHTPARESALTQRLPPAVQLEIRSQALCREELLVEIECAGRIG